MYKQGTTFYEDLQRADGLDLRDNRGLKLNLNFILVSLVIGILRNRDGNMSSLYRHMRNTHSKICDALGIEIEPIISRSHLPRILTKVNLKVFEQLIFERYSIKLTQEQQSWFAGDGKELRGSIEKGKKRGEVVVQIVEHKSRQVVGQSFYNGRKESEKPCLFELIKEKKLSSLKITADALHLYPKLTELINGKGGIFLFGLKENQKLLFEEMKFNIASNAPVAQHQTEERGHGRLEIRNYAAYEVNGAYIDKRWKESSFQTVIRVERICKKLNTNDLSTEISYYITNGKPKKYLEYFEAVREHWSVEVNNHYRDVTLKEDNLRTKIKPVSKVMANCRTLVLELLKSIKPKNMVALLESFQDEFELLVVALKNLKFL